MQSSLAKTTKKMQLLALASLAFLMISTTAARQAGLVAVEDQLPRVLLYPPGWENKLKIEAALAAVEDGKVPSALEEHRELFEVLLSSSGNLRADTTTKMEGLLQHLAENPNYVKDVFPFLASVARRLKFLFPEDIPHLTREHPQKELRRIQVLALLAASFFGIIPHDQDAILMRPRRMNKLDMFYNGFFMRAPKFKALLIYFERMKATLQGCWEQMLRKGEFGKALCLTHCRCRWAPLRGEGSFITPADEVISFFMHTREEAVFESPSGVKVLREAIQPAEIIKSEKPLLPLVVDFDGDITKADGALQVDFADRYVGGLSMYSGHVAQEELIFAIRPELLVMMLFVGALRDDEAVVVKGAESFVLYAGYEHTFEILPASRIPAGKHWSVHGLTPLDDLGRRESTLLVMDALQLNSKSEQYEYDAMMREIVKATVAFNGDPFESLLSERRAAVASGKWGCFIFGGNNELKTILQWIAATYAGRELHYKAFRDPNLANMEETLSQIQKKFSTIKELFEATRKCINARPFGHSRESWSLWKALLEL